jgi:DNA-damage-inducible protein D
VIDLIAFLTETTNAPSYWSVLKQRLKEAEGFDEQVHIEQLKLQAADHRFRLTDTMNRQALLRLLQSVPSPKAEPFRVWLAKVGEERLEEIEHPEKALERHSSKVSSTGPLGRMD